MSEKGTIISSAVYLQLMTIGSIAVASIVGFNYLGSENKRTIREEIAPLVQRLEKAESRIEVIENLLAVNTTRIDASFLSGNEFITHYNRVYHTVFLRPADIEEQTTKRRR